MERIPLTKSSLRQNLDAGKNRKQMSEQYGISVQQVGLALKAAGMDKVRPSTRKFELIDDEKEVTVEQEPVTAEVVTQ